MRLRWPEGKPKCPTCGAAELYAVRRAWPRRSLFWRCKVGGHPEFSLTTGTPFFGRKVSYQVILSAIAIAQHGRGDEYVSHTASKLGLSYSGAYCLVGKAKEFLTGGVEVASRFKGYQSAGRTQGPRAALDQLLSTKVCDQCKIEKPEAQFQKRNGTSKDWALTFSTCKACRSEVYGSKMKAVWATKKVTYQRDVVTEKTAQELLSKPRFGGYWWASHSTWTNQERADLGTLAAAGATPMQAADALGRSDKSIAWYARDYLSYDQMPLSWRRLITPARLIVPAQPRIQLAYPYLPKATNAGGADLVLAVSALVSRAFPDFMRADICQTVLLAILEGKSTLSDLQGSADALRGFVRSYRKANDEPRSITSMDAPRFDDDDRSGHESTLPAGVINRLEW